jgi:glucosamine--fructose-6-phosphate aminotransferase (isomerizing)
MCGIFAYVGKKTNAGEIVVAGLKRLDYRGYDSWGVAVCSDGKVSLEKNVGKISDVTTLTLPESTHAIAHTRWATTGKVTQKNAHPHFSTDHSFALAQNGIVENYLELKEQLLQKGYTFISQTDTEVIVRLIEDELKKTHDLKKAVAAAFAKLAGRNTIILLTNDDQIIACRNGSPLVIGVNPATNEYFISSDTLSFAQVASKMIVVDNGQMLHLNGSLKLYDSKSGKEVPHQLEDIGFTSSSVDKEGYDHFMLKEINEAPFVINQLIKQDEQNYEDLAKALRSAKHVYTIGSGGAGVAASQVAFYLRAIGKIPAVSLIGADAVEYQDLFQKGDLILAISQSGETADVLEVLEEAKRKKVTIASFVNMPGSMISRMSDYRFMSESGPEICVMSTKTFDAQVAFGYLVAKTIVNEGKDAREQLKRLAVTIDEFLKNTANHEQLRTIAKKLAKKHDVFLLAKYQNFHIAREGMIKIVEAAYKHGHALPSGDLKHYVITLMEPGVSVIAVFSHDKTMADVMNAVDEVSLRGAEVIGIGPSSHEMFAEHISVPDMGELGALINLVPLQLLAYYMAVTLGNNVDKPRNIAKSVTVK